MWYLAEYAVYVYILFMWSCYCVYVCMCVFMRVYMFVYMHACGYVCMCVCVDQETFNFIYTPDKYWHSSYLVKFSFDRMMPGCKSFM